MRKIQSLSNGRKKNVQSSWLDSLTKAGKGVLSMLPVIAGVILLLGLFNTFVTGEIITSLFRGVYIFDGLVGSLLGSILAGNAITSYIIGNELLSKQVSLFAVTTFMVSWVTVGLVQLPAEMTALGKRFSLLRNAISFLLSFVVAGLVTFTMEIIA
ncbi:MAG TPA: permease [Candidatus Thermoplasmatota archaeon]|nr:permease [Candidatus Thermoplasmatota archaeon]